MRTDLEKWVSLSHTFSLFIYVSLSLQKIFTSPINLPFIMSVMVEESSKNSKQEGKLVIFFQEGSENNIF